MPRNGVYGVHGSSVSKFLRNVHTYFHSGAPDCTLAMNKGTSPFSPDKTISDF